MLKGFTPEDPIPCDGPKGEKGYIEALRCPLGAEYEYHRIRPVAVVNSQDKIMIVDEYLLNCRCPKRHSRRVYFDMYHGELMRKLRGR
jgi:hypothetical protein